MSDLTALYDLRKWLREPAAHAIKEFLNYISSNNRAIIAELLNDNGISSFFVPQNDLTVEQIASHLHLQTIFSGDESIPNILKKPLLTVASLEEGDNSKGIQCVLRDTSVVVYPRCHMVWETVWLYLCEEIGSGKGKKKSKISKKSLVLRKACPVGKDSPVDVLKAIVNNVIIEGLLGQSDVNSITHERRVLAMALVSRLCQFQLPPDVIEKAILHPTIISKLFIQTLQKQGRGGQNANQHNHTLKPLALNILNNIIKSLCSEESNTERRLAVVKSFLQAHPSFDTITKTQTVSSLLGMNKNNKGPAEKNEPTSFDYELWKSYLSFLQKEMFEKLTCEDGISDATKFVDLIFNFTKQVARVGNDDNRQYFFRRASLILATGAFFDLEGFKSKSKKDKANDECAKSIAQSIYKELKQKKAFISIPHSVRVMMSSRFFSLLSDYIATDKRGKLRSLKTSLIIAENSHFQNEIETLQSLGAKLINEGSPIDDEDSDHNGLSPLKSSLKLCGDLRKIIAEEENETKSLGLSSMLALLSSLSLLLLHPGQLGIEEKNPDEDEIDEVFDEIHETLCELSETASTIKNNNEEEDDNPLSSLATIYVNLLNSSIGGSNSNICTHLGGGPRLVRDCVQISWMSMLSALSDKDSTSKSFLDEEVMSVILESICSPQAFSDPMADGDNEDEEDLEMEDSESSDNDGESSMGAFTEATETGVDIDDMDVDESGEKKNEDTEDIELDPSALENLLLEDREALGSDDEDEMVLEHHSGADDALAQLIKLKQEARKAGQSKQEKAELSNRLRCFTLLESVFSSSKRNELPNKIALMVILPLLRTRTILLKSLITSEHSISNKNAILAPDQRALMTKITSFLETKICKIQFRNEKTSLDACQTLSKQIMSELKSVSNADHCKLCSSLFVAVIKAVGGDMENDVSKTLAESIYNDAMKEWSQKKNTRLQSSIFEDLIQKCPE